MALQKINPIGLPIEETYTTSTQVTKAVAAWDNPAVNMVAEPYQGSATIRFNGAVKNHFAPGSEPSGIDNRLVYDKNVSLIMSVGTDEYWVTRASKQRTPKNGFMSHIRPAYYEGYPCELVFCYYNDGTEYTAAKLTIDGSVITQATGVHILKIEASTISRYMTLEATRADGSKEVWRWDGTITYILNSTLLTNSTYILNEKRDIPGEPFYVRWVNQYGGYDYWMFQGKKRQQNKLTSLTTYEVHGGGGVKHLLAHEAAEQISASTGIVNKTQAQSLEHIIYSPDVCWYDESTGEWVNIHPQKGATHQWDTDQPTGEIIMTFDLPTPQLVV